jgi:DNA-binding NarL/FixJ family response regulator
MATVTAPAPPRPAADAHGRAAGAAAAGLRRRIRSTLAADRIEAATPRDSTSSVLLVELTAARIAVMACDIDNPGELAALRRFRRESPETRAVVVSPLSTGVGIRRGLEAGADAIVFEPRLEATLAIAVRAVASGQSVVPRELRAGVERPAFSHRERQVLGLVAEGQTNAQIASELFLSESTIKSHLASAFSKLGVRSRKEAAAVFLELEPAAPNSPVNPS